VNDLAKIFVLPSYSLPSACSLKVISDSIIELGWDTIKHESYILSNAQNTVSSNSGKQGAP
jgi:hypothetical protein